MKRLKRISFITFQDLYQNQRLTIILDAIANLDPDLSINIDELERKTSDSVDASNTKS